VDGLVTGGAAFLELLAADAPAVEYERPVAAARAGGASDAEIAELDRAKLLALGLRDVLADRRRRETELAALYETANDLAAMRDLDSVLQAIVDRARALLGTDTAYLTLLDRDAGTTQMRVTAGSISAHFQRLTLGPGEGLGGLVATTALPYVTANYFGDARFRHTSDIDGAVQDEGLVAILGVPLVLNHAVLGVLFAANRRERPFAHAEVALLRSLATHAAIAIDTARALEDNRRALAGLNAANEVVKARSASVERAAEAHDRLADLVLRGGGIDDVAGAVAEVLDGEVRLLTPAEVPAADAPSDADRRLAAAVESALATGRAGRSGDIWVAAAAAGTAVRNAGGAVDGRRAGELLGALVLRGRPELDGADQRILERAAMVTALLLLFRRSVSEVENRVRGELLDDLLDGHDHDPAALRARARRLSADLEVPHVAVVLAADDADRERLRAAAAHLAATRHGLAGIRDGRHVLLLPGDAPARAAREIAADIGTAVGCPVTAGAAGPVTGQAAFPEAYREAARCLAALRVLGRTGDVAASGDLGFLGLLLGGRDVAGFVAATVGPLTEYDERRGTNLTATLECYFAVGGNLARAKDELHVHVNTVTQRLDRVSRVLGPDWRDPERALEIQLALRLRRLTDV
jgi:DNA-binding PucR family transcriptional regulator